MFTSSLRSWLAGLLLIGCAAPASFAQAPLDLATVLDQTLRHHPVLARIDAERRRIEPAVALAHQSPPLRVGLETENFGSDGRNRLESTLSLSGVLEWGGQPKARAGLALSENEALLLQLAQQRRNVLAEAAMRFIALAGAQETLAHSRRAQELVQQTHAVTLRRQQAGAASQADVERTELALAQAEMAVVNAEQALQTARLALRLAVGAPQIPVPSVVARLDVLPELPKATALLALAQTSPAVQLANARESIALNRLELARRQARPDFEWSLGIRDERERDDQSLVLGFTLPLGQASRSRPRRERARAGVDIAEQDREIAQLELQALLLDSWQALATWKREAETLDTRLIPQGESIVEALRNGYSRGRYSLLELSSAETDLNTLRGQRLAARIRYHQSWIALERLLGRPLIPENRS